MNREIKFRAYLKGSNEVIDITGFEFRQGKFVTLFLNDGFRVEALENVMLLQYTGLKDKDGKEIYEGDLVNNFNCGPNTVVFENGAFGYVINNDEDLHYFVSFAGNDNFRWLYNSSDRIEVIGNIYENPELLK